MIYLQLKETVVNDSVEKEKKINNLDIKEKVFLKKKIKNIYRQKAGTIGHSFPISFYFFPHFY